MGREKKRAATPLRMTPSARASIDVVLLPVERGIGLNDGALARSLLEFLDERGLAGLEGLGDFWMHAQGDAGGVQIGGHLARLGLNLVADGGHRFDHARAGA